MGTEKLDRRVRYTKMVIRESFLQLLEEKPAGKITVKEICACADINRGTFYAHYADCAALMDELETEFARELIDDVSHMYIGKNYLDDVIDRVLKTLRGNPPMCAIVLDPSNPGKSFEMVTEYSYKKMIPSWLSRSSMTAQDAELVLSYIVGGSHRVLQMWYKGGFAADDGYIKKTLLQVITTGLFGMLGKTK